MEQLIAPWQAVKYFTSGITLSRRNLAMPGDPNYQPADLKPYLGFDQWTCWLIVIEWFWMLALAQEGIMPPSDAKYLTNERLLKLLQMIPNTRARELERSKTKHDILALLELMRQYLPKALHKWLHYCATSYDIICTAYALMNKMVFRNIIWKKLCEVDDYWRDKIREYASIVMPGRTHLQTALPITLGLWHANLHNRYILSGREANKLSERIPGKFTGAVGTSASQVALIGNTEMEDAVMTLLRLPVSNISTQISPPEANARFYFELLLLSGVLANFADDVRTLQSSQYGELVTESSSSSAMAHKQANPIAAENDAGMHVSVIAEFMKIPLTLTSNLQRDLRWSNVMRSYSAEIVFFYQQLETTLRILKTMSVDQNRCWKNFKRESHLVVAELLHYFLQSNGYIQSHHFVNSIIIPNAKKSRNNLALVMDNYCATGQNIPIQKIWKKVSPEIRAFLEFPEKYLGNAVEIALNEANNSLCEAG